MSIQKLVEELERERVEEHEEQQRIEEDYRREVAEALADGHISELEEQTLEDERERLGLSPEAATRIRAGEMQTVEEKQRSLRRYEEAIELAIEVGGYPIDEVQTEELKKRQAKLGLQDEEVVGLVAQVAIRLRLEEPVDEPGPVEEPEVAVADPVDSLAFGTLRRRGRR